VNNFDDQPLPTGQKHLSNWLLVLGLVSSPVLVAVYGIIGYPNWAGHSNVVDGLFIPILTVGALCCTASIFFSRGTFRRKLVLACLRLALYCIATATALYIGILVFGIPIK
jgi:hypothetical protein